MFFFRLTNVEKSDILLMVHPACKHFSQKNLTYLRNFQKARRKYPHSFFLNSYFFPKRIDNLKTFHLKRTAQVERLN